MSEKKELLPQKEEVRLRKPPASKQSERFDKLEQHVLLIVGEDYWSWLESKYQELVVNDAIGFKE